MKEIICRFLNMLLDFVCGNDNITSILDIGCGHSAETLVEIRSKCKGCKLVGVDSLINRMDLELHNDGFYLPDSIIFHYQDGLEYMQKSSEKYDLIIFKNFIHFYPLEKLRAYFIECENLLNKSGFIYLQMANEHHDYSQENDKYIHKQESIKTYLENSFFCIKNHKEDKWNKMIFEKI